MRPAGKHADLRLSPLRTGSQRPLGDCIVAPSAHLTLERGHRRPVRRPGKEAKTAPPWPVIREGDSVAVVGCGGVGLNVIQGAKVAGAERIIAVDIFQPKLMMAEQFGATDLVRADQGDIVTTVVGLTGGRGVEAAFEMIGLGLTIEQTINMTRTGGEAILVGIPRTEVMLNLNAALTFLYSAKTVKGCWYGSSNIREDVPKLIELYRSGQLKLEELVSREIGVEGVNDAFTAMQQGEVARSLIIHQH